ncbi:MAG: CBS domain-containing protein [Planctomycetia bacterium]|nr:CBS domain-containing protein [Planctomycetia bacterium]
MQVKDVMTVDPVCVTPDTTLSQVATLMVESNCGAILVVDDLSTKRVVGIVTDRDIVCRSVARGENTSPRLVASTMSSPVATVFPDTSVDQCCEVMQVHQYRRVAVVDAEDRCLGIVAQADLARHATLELVAETLRQISLDSPAGLG